MTEGRGTFGHRELLAESTRRLRAAQARVEELERAQREPLAIIGAGLRLPGGACDLDQLGELLVAGGDAITDLTLRPDGRRDTDGADGAPVTAAGALSNVDGFDADFFGIPRAEAVHVDPQQRLLLEVAWEAIEDAGVRADRLRRRRVGVFIGVYANDYLMLELDRPERISAYTAPGGANSIAANRLSYLLDLRGPSVAVDTACSSSLVALHLACRALRADECEYALVGGVNLILSPISTIITEKVLPLAPGGRCRTFDAAAEGIVRSEGCAVVLLQRAVDATRAGRRARAIVRGTAVNHDGQTNGLTAPNPDAQRELMECALEDGGVRAADVTYVEAHGTGTPLGDPVEVTAVREVYGDGDSPCALGSVKANLGHLEAAAGVAGLMKAIAVLERGIVPPQIHLDRLNPEIDIEGSRLFVPREPTPLPESAERMLAAVSSFGFGGTNAHVVVEAPPRVEAAAAEVPDHLVLPLSARSGGALEALAERYANLLGGSPEEVADICAAAAHHRTHLERRLCVVGENAVELRRRLAEAGRSAATRAPVTEPRVAFVFGGQGSQWPGMGRDLMENEPVAREIIQACDDDVRRIAGWSVIDELRAEGGASHLHETGFGQVAIFVVQLALAALWRSWGIEPDAVAGHSLGEVTAACVAGALDRRDAAEVIVHRARLAERARGGAMASLGLRLDEAEAFVAEDGLEVAAVNASSSTVVTGRRAAVEELVENAARRGIRARLLPVEYAFHSSLLDGADRELAAAVRHVSARKPEVALFSTVTGDRVTAAQLHAAHWGRNLRAPVRFADALSAIAADGIATYVEVSPHPVLAPEISRHLSSSRSLVVVGSLRRETPAAATLRGSLARLFEAGCEVDWEALVAPPSGPVQLPRYPWQRQRFWLTPSGRGGGFAPAAPPPEPAESPAAAALDDVAGRPLEQRIEVLTRHVRERVAEALGLDGAAAVPPDAPFEALGVDSVMVVELKNELEHELGTVVPMTELLEEASSPRHVARLLAERAKGFDPGGVSPERASQLLADLDQLSDADVDAALGALMSEE